MTPTRMKDCQVVENQLLHSISKLNPNLPKPKLLKSCVRCRKHKTKCDANIKSPSPCSSCFKKGVSCTIDYVLPPQRSDNLKNLVSKVDSLHDNYDLINKFQQQIAAKLGLRLMDFEIFKMQKLSEDQNDEMLIKLSNNSFISLKLLDDSLYINNNSIDIHEFNQQLQILKSKFNLIYEIATINTMDVVSDSSSISSPNLSITPSKSTHEDWLNLDFNIETLFNSNKFLLIMLIDFFYPEIGIDFALFIEDYLSSYFSIVETMNKTSNTPTYSSLLMNKSTIFNKSQLSSYINSEIFNSEFFLRKLIQLLFLNVLLNGFEQLETFNFFIKFVETNINNNRKKLNFDKNGDLKFIELMLQYLTSLQTQLITTPFTKKKNKELLDFEDRVINDKFFQSLDTLLQELYKLNRVETDSKKTLFQTPQPQNFKKEAYQSSFNYFMDFFLPYVSQFHSRLNPTGAYLIFFDRFLLEFITLNSFVIVRKFHNLEVELYHSRLMENYNIKSLDAPFEMLGHLVENIHFQESQQPITVNDDIQVILEAVDWKKETTDDVLKKIGVI